MAQLSHSPVVEPELSLPLQGLSTLLQLRPQEVQRRDPGTRPSKLIVASKPNDPFLRNAAVANVRPLRISVPVLAALAATAGRVLFGAWMAV